MGGFVRFRGGYQRDAGSIDVEDRTVHGVDRMNVIQDVVRHAKGDALDPVAVIEVEQERGERKLVVIGIEGGSQVAQTVNSGMQAHRIRHVVEIIEPHVYVVAVSDVELHVDAVDVGLLGEIVEAEVAPTKLHRPLWAYVFKFVRHGLAPVFAGDDIMFPKDVLTTDFVNSSSERNSIVQIDNRGFGT